MPRATKQSAIPWSLKNDFFYFTDFKLQQAVVIIDKAKPLYREDFDVNILFIKKSTHGGRATGAEPQHEHTKE